VPVTDNCRERSIYREKVLNAYLFNSLDEARRITADQLEKYNSNRPHAALEKKPFLNFPLVLKMPAVEGY